MSFYEDYIADGACCQCCGVFIDDDCGYPRSCEHCAEPESPPKLTKSQKSNARKRRAKKRKAAACNAQSPSSQALLPASACS